MSSTPTPQSSQPSPEPQAPTPAAKPPLRSSKVSRTDKTAPAAKTEAKPAAKLEPKAKAATKASAGSGVVALSPRSSHNLKSDAAPGLANRPIDPSPIQVSRSVSLAGIRPIGISVNPQPIVLTPTSMVLNRPIADNSSDDDDTLMGYLD